MSKIFFTSDLHLSHQNIIKYCNRPWETAEAMNEALISNWNHTVGPDDIVYLLGDVFFCQAQEAMRLLARLNGKIRLVLGNHDKVIRNHVPLQKMFDMVLPALYGETIDGIHVVMCHYPMLSWNRSERGSFCLHGHVHSVIPNDGQYRRYDVGVDGNGYAPVSFEHIKSVLTKIEPSVHH